MREIVYSVAMSLDGKIAGPEGEYDWIPEGDEIDWQAFMARFDTVLVGRKTWEIMAGTPQTLPTYVVSTTLPEVDDEKVTVVREDVEGFVRDLKATEGRQIWLMGGGRLFRHLLELGLVDEVEVAVMPVLLGDGIPLLPSWNRPLGLTLADSHVYPGGIALLRYRVER
jgi:dihydrofolate reductase